MSDNQTHPLYELRPAARDYFFLLNRDYPEKPVLKLVGDRYRLSRIQRQILFRGITSEAKSLSRRARICRELRGERLHIDGYNVFLTVMNYLLGKTFFIANDNMLRDVGENYGSIKNKEVFRRAVNLLLGWLKANGVEVSTIYLDSPVSHSALHMQSINQRMAELGTGGEVRLAKSADYELKHIRSGIIATSDSVIIDASSCPVADLARHLLEAQFSIHFICLEDLL